LAAAVPADAVWAGTGLVSPCLCDDHGDPAQPANSTPESDKTSLKCILRIIETIARGTHRRGDEG